MDNNVIEIEIGNMNLTVKSAHVYDKDREKVNRILDDINKMN